MYKVIISGKDCDGFSCNRTYEFDSYKEDIEFVENFNDASDGLLASLIDNDEINL